MAYFSNQGDYWVYSPQEQKRTVLLDFPLLAEIYRTEKESKMGSFPLKIQTLIFLESPTEDK